MRKLQLVEYPANVKNVDKMIDTLGGMKNIHSVSTLVPVDVYA